MHWRYNLLSSFLLSNGLKDSETIQRTDMIRSRWCLQALRINVYKGLARVVTQHLFDEISNHLMHLHAWGNNKRAYTSDWTLSSSNDLQIYLCTLRSRLNAGDIYLFYSCIKRECKHRFGNIQAHTLVYVTLR